MASSPLSTRSISHSSNPNPSAISSLSNSSSNCKTHVIKTSLKRSWKQDECDNIVKLMMSQFDQYNDVDQNSRHPPSTSLTRNDKTLDLFVSSDPSSSNLKIQHNHIVPLDAHAPLPLGWEKCLDLKTGEVYYTNYVSRERTLKDISNSHKHLSITIEQSNAKFNLESELMTQKILDPIISSSQQQYEHELDVIDFQVDDNPTLSLAIGSVSSNSFSSTLVPRKRHKTSTSSIQKSSLGLKLDISTSNDSITSTNGSPNHLPFVDHGLLHSNTLSIDKPKEDFEALPYDDKDEDGSLSNSSMVILSCPSCLMYVMLRRSKPRCPNCGSSYFNDTNLTNS